MSEILHRTIKQEIERANHIVLLTDERIDGDTVGSALGMYHVMRAAGKRVEIFSPSAMIESLAFLPGTDAIQRDLAMFDQASIDLLMIFDCADGAHLEKLPIRAKQVPLIVFDHHASNPRYGTINLIEQDAASTADVLWRFIKWAGLPVNKDASQCILTGVITDTDTFSTTNTTTAALTAAHELTRYGANQQQIVRETMMNKSIATLKLWGIALERLHQNKEFGVLTTAITMKDVLETGVDEPDTKALSNFLNAITDVEATLVLKETADGDVKGSLRSIEKNVKEIALRYGGGGHDRAAGFKIPSAHLEEEAGEWKVVRA
jgi:phosphoesterase RecJ-like protein